MRIGLHLAAVSALGFVIVSCGDDTSDPGGAGGSSSSSSSTSTSTSTSGSSSSTGEPGQPIGSACGTNEECAGGLCLAEGSSFGWADGYCSSFCEPSLSPCTEGECLSAGGFFICIKTCDPNAPPDCDGAGQQCLNLGQGEPAYFCIGGCSDDSECDPASKCDPARGITEDIGACVPKEICDNAIDDDGDQFVDCADEECSTVAACMAQIGAACTSPTELTSGVQIEATTADGTSLFQGVCPGFLGDSNVGLGKEHVYRFLADASGVLHLTATQVMGDFALYVRTDCADGTTQIACADNEFNPNTAETADIPLVAGDEVTVYVDAYVPGAEGDFTLDVDFEAAVCGDGTTTAPEECDDGGMQANDGCSPTCAIEPAFYCQALTPIVVGTTAGDNSNGTTVFEPTNEGAIAMCFPGAGDANESVYTYVPLASGMLTITVSSATDQGIYVRTACATADSEIACHDQFNGGTDEVVTVPVTLATPITIFVDAYVDAGPFSITLALN